VTAYGWWITFIRGLVALALGGALLVAGAGESRLATFIGVYWLLGAVLTARWVMRSRGAPGRRLAVVAAAIGILAALALLGRRPLHPVLGTGALFDVVGAAAIAIGVLRMLGGFQAQSSAPRHHSILIGALDVGIGAVLIITSDASSAWVRFVAAAWGLAGGTLLLLDALRMRNAQTTRIE
jgi:uncharacterized membrane protein HdeD (DUF308 family)